MEHFIEEARRIAIHGFKLLRRRRAVRKGKKKDGRDKAVVEDLFQHKAFGSEHAVQLVEEIYKRDILIQKPVHRLFEAVQRALLQPFEIGKKPAFEVFKFGADGHLVFGGIRLDARNFVEPRHRIERIDNAEHILRKDHLGDHFHSRSHARIRRICIIEHISVGSLPRRILHAVDYERFVRISALIGLDDRIVDAVLLVLCKTHFERSPFFLVAVLRALLHRKRDVRRHIVLLDERVHRVIQKLTFGTFAGSVLFLARRKAQCKTARKCHRDRTLHPLFHMFPSPMKRFYLVTVYHPLPWCCQENFDVFLCFLIFFRRETHKQPK